MATQYSNKPIVTDGLVYALDFGNPKSYVSGSSSANSLKFFPTTASFAYYGGLSTIPNLVNGLLQLSGSVTSTGSQLVTNTQFSDLIPSGDFTVQLTLNNRGNGIFITQGPSDTRLISTLNTSGTALGWYINPLPYAQAGGPGGNYYTRNYLLSSRLQHLTYRYSSGSYDLFVNGIPVSPSGRYDNITTNSGNLTINGAQGSGFSNTDLGNFYIYDRALTANEIYSNYLIQAQRYGLPITPKPYSIDENAYLFLSQSGITDPIITSSIDTFVRGLKSASLWDKMIAIYPFVGTGSEGINLTGSQSWNLKEPTSAFYRLAFTGSWNGSTSGSTPSGSNTFIDTGVLPYEYYPFKSDSNQHISILSYDTPTSSSYLMGTGMTEELAASTLAGDYGTPAAAYSVRKVRTAYSGALMDVRRSLDNVTASIGYVSNGDLDTGSLLDWTIPGRNDLPGIYSGLAAAYSLRKVSSSYSGYAVKVRGDIENQTRDIGFDAEGNLDTGSLLSFTATGSNVLAGSYSGLAAAYSLRKVVPGYAGDAIEVQSGSVSQSIGFDSIGNLDTGSLLTFVGSGDAFVKTWYDQSGNGNDVTQTTTSLQPRIVLNGSISTQEGKPAVHFYTQTTVLTRPTLHQTLTQPNTVHWVGNIGGNAAAAFDSYTPGGGLLFWTFNNFLMQTPSQLSLGTRDTNRHSFSLLYSGSSSSGYIDGVLKNTGNAGTNSVVGLSIGDSDYAGNAMQGYMQEFTLYNSDQSSNRTYIENNINAYYDIYTTSSVSTENAFVNTWYDQSGNSRHATQTTASSQPLIVVSGSLVIEGTKPAVKFYTNLGMDTGFTGLVTKSLFITANTEPGLNRNDNAQRLFSSYTGGGGVGNELILDGQGTGSFRYIDGGVTLSVSQTASYQLTTAIRNSTLNLAFNGGSINSGGTPNSSPNTLNYRIGEDAGVSSIETAKSIQEIILYNNDQSSNRPLIENNINNYYQIYTGSNHGFVERWYDQSGNNRHASQTATGSQPIIVESGSIIFENGKPAIYANQSNLTLPNTLNFNDLGWFVVSKKDGVGNSGIILTGGSGGGAGDGFDGNFTPRFVIDYTDVIGGSLGNSFPFTGVDQHLSYYQRVGSTAVGGYNGLITGSASGITTAGFGLTSLFYYGLSAYRYQGKVQELTLYPSSKASDRQAIEYGINSYYNIYPQTSSFATSSFTIKADPTSISGSINNKLTSGIASSGPLGLITVSRTGSNSLTLARNGVTSSFDVPASGALSTGIYLGAINNNGIAVGSSPLGISFASVGTGLTDSDVINLNENVGLLNINLKRAGVLNTYDALAAYSLRLLDYGYTGPAVTVRRTSDNTTSSIGFDSNGDLDITSLLTFTGTSNAYVTTWYDQSGNNKHISQAVTGSQPLLVTSGSIVTAKTFEAYPELGINPYNNNTKPAIYFSNNYLDLGTPIGSISQASYYIVYGLGGNSRSSGYSLFQTNTDNETTAWYYGFGYPDGYINVFSPDGSGRRNSFPYRPPQGGTTLWSAFHGPGNNMTVYFQGNIDKGTNTSLAFSSGSMFKVGRGSDYSFDGTIQELILYPDASTSRKNFLENNINNYYQIY